MTGKQTAEGRIDALIDGIKDKAIRDMLKISQRSRKYPKDCITDGSLEELAKRIRGLEEKAEAAK